MTVKTLYIISISNRCCLLKLSILQRNKMYYGLRKYSKQQLFSTLIIIINVSATNQHVRMICNAED